MTFFTIILVGYYFLCLQYWENEKIKNFLDSIFKMKPIHEEHVYAIDFDNTIAYTEFPKIIKPIPYAVEVLQILTEDPYSTLILWTCREGKCLEDALNFCKLHKIKFDYINENCKRNLDLYKNDCRKISADVYIDDHSYEGIKGVEKLWKDWWNWLNKNYE